MVTLEFEAKSFKKMEDPINRGGEKVKYVCYAKAKLYHQSYIIGWEQTLENKK